MHNNYKVKLSDPDPRYYNELTWSYSSRTIFNKLVSDNKPVIPGEDPNTFFKDTNQLSSPRYQYYAALTLSFYEPFVDTILNTILTQAHNTTISTMKSIIKDTLSYAEYNAYGSAFWIQIKGDRIEPLDNQISVEIDKMTLKHTSQEYIPLMIKYSITVNVSSHSGTTGTS